MHLPKSVFDLRRRLTCCVLALGALLLFTQPGFAQEAVSAPAPAPANNSANGAPSNTPSSKSNTKNQRATQRLRRPVRPRTPSRRSSFAAKNCRARTARRRPCRAAVFQTSSTPTCCRPTDFIPRRSSRATRCVTIGRALAIPRKSRWACPTDSASRWKTRLNRFAIRPRKDRSVSRLATRSPIGTKFRSTRRSLRNTNLASATSSSMKVRRADG
jgi:hypothetical protein